MYYLQAEEAAAREAVKTYDYGTQARLPCLSDLIDVRTRGADTSYLILDTLYFDVRTRGARPPCGCGVESCRWDAVQCSALAALYFILYNLYFYNLYFSGGTLRAPQVRTATISYPQGYFLHMKPSIQATPGRTAAQGAQALRESRYGHGRKRRRGQACAGMYNMRSCTVQCVL